MAQKLISFYCFNEDSASSVKDFSTNERHSSSVTGLTIGVGAVGKVGIFDGATTNINFGNITAFNGLEKFSICTKFKLSVLGVRHIISFRNDNNILEVTTANNVKFTLVTGGITGATYELTDTQILTTGIFYTVVAIYDGVNIRIEIDTIDVSPILLAATGETSANFNDLIVGSDFGMDFFNGAIEMLSFYSLAFSENEIITIFEQPSGIRFETQDGKLRTGDLILNNAGGSEVVTWYEEFDERLFSDGEIHNFNDNELIIFKN